MDSPAADKLPSTGSASELAKKRYLLIANPHSGHRQTDTAVDAIQSSLKAHGCEAHIRLTEYPGHARQIAKDIDLDGYAGLCFVGGDGTFHEIVSGLFERSDKRRIPVGILPGGTGNDVARHLGINSIQHGIQLLLAGRARPFDVAKVTTPDETLYCTTLVGWNAVAEVNRQAERFRRLGTSRYALAAMLMIIRASRRPATLVLDSEKIEDEFLLVAACNTPYIGGGMRFAPNAVTDDGKLDVIVVRQATRWRLLQLFLKMFSGKHVNMQGVEYYQTARLSIVANDARPLDIDGEVIGTVPVAIEVLPEQLQIFC